MEEHQLKELAYTIFFGACGKRSNAEHVQVMRAQLEVSSSAKSPNVNAWTRLLLQCITSALQQVIVCFAFLSSWQVCHTTIC